jgi:hypothetical protein
VTVEKPFSTRFKSICASTTRLVCAFSLIFDALIFERSTALAQPVEAENICPGLTLTQGKTAELYFKAPDGRIKPFDTAYFSELVGRRISFCYLARHSEEDDSSSTAPQRGAINPKIELWQPNQTNHVLLFNNHRDPSCKQRNYGAYQHFHETRIEDPCLNLFHNLPSDFSTLQDGRRLAFVFPPLTLFDRLKGASDSAPVKRMSHIYNYVASKDLSAIRIPFHFTTSPELRALRVTIDDLLENSDGRSRERIRVTK